MYKYYIIIFLPVTNWLSKILSEFILCGWKISSGGPKPDSEGTLSGRIALWIESDSQEFDTTVKVHEKAQDILNRNEISFFGIVIVTGSFSLSLSPSNTELKKEPKTTYRG